MTHTQMLSEYLAGIAKNHQSAVIRQDCKVMSLLVEYDEDMAQSSNRIAYNLAYWEMTYHVAGIQEAFILVDFYKGLLELVREILEVNTYQHA